QLRLEVPHVFNARTNQEDVCPRDANIKCRIHIIIITSPKIYLIVFDLFAQPIDKARQNWIIVRGKMLLRLKTNRTINCSIETRLVGNGNTISQIGKRWYTWAGRIHSGAMNGSSSFS